MSADGNGPATGPPAKAASGPNPIALLARVLEHEQKQGCRDTAVIGGLDGMLRSLRERAEPEQKRARPAGRAY